MKILLLCALIALTGCYHVPSPLRDKTTIVQANARPPTGGVVSVGGYTLHRRGETIVVSATPFSGWRFVRWSDGEFNPIRNYTVPRRATVLTAEFEIMGANQP